MYSMIDFCELSEVFSATELAILMISSLCHDLDHPGLSNMYVMPSGSMYIGKLLL